MSAPIEELPGVVYRCRAAPGWPMEYVGGNCESVTGYPPSAIENGEVSYEELVHPEDRPRARATVERAIDGAGEFEVSYRIRTREDDDQWVRERGRVVDAGADSPGLAGFVADDTDRVDRERSLARYETILETIEDVAFVVDEDWRLAYVNPAVEQFVESTPEQLVGRPIAALAERYVLEDDPEQFEAALERAFRGESTDRLELPVYAPATDDRRVHEYRVSPVGEDPEEVVVAVRDVTDRVRRERRLRRQADRLEEFAGVVSHDLRTPLSRAEGQLRLLRRELGIAGGVGTARAAGDGADGIDDVDPETVADRVDAVADAHDRMRRLIDDLLTLAREGDPDFEPEPVDLDRAVRRCWGPIAEPGTDLVVETGATVLAGPQRLRRLLENLLRNCVEHGSTGSQTESGDTVEHGSTSSRTESDDSVEHGSLDRSTADPDRRDGDASDPDRGGVAVTIGDLADGFYVADDGPGIPPADRDQVFDRGYSTADDGTGLGLAIVARIAEAHDWAVSVGESDDGGARFEFTGVDFAD